MYHSDGSKKDLWLYVSLWENDPTSSLDLWHHYRQSKSFYGLCH